LAARSADGQGESKPSAVLPSDPIFQATLLDGSTIEGRLSGLSLDAHGQGAARFEREPHQSIPIDQLIGLSRQVLRSQPPPAGPIVVLPSRHTLRAIVSSADETSLEVLSPWLGARSVRVPLDRILGIVLAPSIEPDILERQLFQIRGEERDGDTVWLTNGDRRAGRIVRLEAERLVFDQGNGEGPIARDGLTALAFDPALVAYPAPGPVFAEIKLADGSTLGVTTLDVARGRIRGNTLLGVPLDAPVDAVTSVLILSPRVTYLTDREPAAAQYTPYLDRHPSSFGHNTTWDGHPLQLAGRPYNRGLGMLPRTLVAYKIEPGDARFQALVGLDDRSGELASVVFRVLVDRNELFSIPPMTPRDPPLAIDVDIAGGNLLILIAEFAQRGDVHDHADWAQARIIRSPEPRPGGTTAP
jgi:hypothetical protein